MKKIKKILITSLLGLGIISLSSCDLFKSNNTKPSTVVKSTNTPKNNTETTKSASVISTKESNKSTNTNKPGTSNVVITNIISSSNISSTTNKPITSNTTTSTNKPVTSNITTNISTNIPATTSVTSNTTIPTTHITTIPTTHITTVPTTTTISTVPTTVTTIPTTAPTTNTSIISTSTTSIPSVDDVILVNDYRGYNEGIYVEIAKISNTSLNDYNFYYKLDTESKYTKIDKQLIRDYNSIIRADMVGLKAGNYSIMVELAGYNKILDNIIVTNHDRSGYAHFNYIEGVGAYKDDGTLKDNAVVVYVNEENKNTVKAKIGSKTYEGLSEIIKNATDENYPVDVRIIGTVGAATWQKNSPAVSSYSAATTTTVKGLNNKYLSLANYDEEDIIKGKFNSLDESVYTKLNGLTNKIKYDENKKEFDSYYNMLDVKGAKNVTIEGIGEDACIFQWGFTWKADCRSIEIRNITFDDYTEDACSFEGSGADSDLVKLSSFTSTNYWIHNNTFNRGVNYWDVCSEQDKHDGDGATDFKRIAYATISYNHYYNNHKTGLVGGGDSQITAALTFHHNFYENCQARLPFARQANMHMYNNYYYNTSGNNMQIYAGAYAFVENCYFAGIKKTYTVTNEYFKTNDKQILAGKTYYNKNKEVVTYDVGTEIVSQKINGVDIYEKRKPAVKSFNNIYENSSSSGATIVTSRDAKVTNGNLFGNDFDTDSSIFYYDKTNNRSNVSLMLDTKDVPEYVTTYAGAGKLFSTTSTTPVIIDPTPTTEGEFEVVYFDDFSTNKDATIINGNPTQAGLYYHIGDKESNDSVEADSTNYVKVTNGALNIHDESTTTTTWGYYMFNETYSTGIVRYSIDFIPTKQSSNWAMIQFIGSNNRLAIKSNADKKLCYSTEPSNNDATVLVSTSAYDINTVHTIILTIDYDNEKVTISIDGIEKTISNYDIQAIKGLVFMTAVSDAKRSFTIDNIKIEKYVIKSN